MTELTAEQQEAVERSPDFPGHVADPRTGRAEVLLRSDDFDWIRQLLVDEPDAPRRRHPRTGVVYAVLLEEHYERFKAFFEEDPLTPTEKQALLREAGKRAGWNDPAWDAPEAP